MLKAFGAGVLFAMLGAVQGDTSYGPAVGSAAPDFVLKDSQGNSYRLSDLKGKKVVLEFFRSGSW